MNTDQRIKEHFERNNLSYTNADDAIARILHDHKQYRENNQHLATLIKHAKDKAILDANEHIKHLSSNEYISVDELKHMTIQEIVDFLK